MDRLRALACFVEVVERRSFSEAARALGLSKAAVSKYVAWLEADLDARLLHRTTRQVRATAVGRAVRARAGALLDQARELKAAAHAERAEPAGTLRVSAPVSLGLLYLGDELAGFVRAFPAVRVEVALTDRFVRLADEGIDVALRVAPRPVDEELIAVRLGSVRMVACAAPAYLAEAGRPRRPRDLVRHACLAYAEPGASGRVPWRFRAGGDEEVVWVEPLVRADNSLLLRDLARAGLGVALLPSFVCDGDLARGTLVELLGSARTEGRTLEALYPAQHRGSAKVRAFVRHLQAAFAGRE